MFKDLNRFSQEVCEHANKRKLFDLYCVVRGARCSMLSSSRILNILFANQLKMKDASSNTLCSASKFICRQGRAGYLTASAVITKCKLYWTLMDDNVGLPVMESSGQVCVQFQIMPPTTKTAEEKSYFFPIFKKRCDVKAGGQKQILYLDATDINLYRHIFRKKRKKKECFRYLQKDDL